MRYESEARVVYIVTTSQPAIHSESLSFVVYKTIYYKTIQKLLLLLISKQSKTKNATINNTQTLFLVKEGFSCFKNKVEENNH